jgi:hypothetical protein
MDLYEQSLQDRKYFKNVSPATIVFYQNCFKALPIDPHNVKPSLLAGIQATSINDYIRGNTAFLNWCHQEGIVKEHQN